MSPLREMVGGEEDAVRQAISLPPPLLAAVATQHDTTDAAACMVNFEIYPEGPPINLKARNMFKFLIRLILLRVNFCFPVSSIMLTEITPLAPPPSRNKKNFCPPSIFFPPAQFFSCLVTYYNDT